MERYHDHELDAELLPGEPQPPVGERAIRALKSLFVRE